MKLWGPNRRAGRWLWIAFGGAALLLAGGAPTVAESEAPKEPAGELEADALDERKSHYFFHFDNDLFSPSTTDRDYTFGVALLATSQDKDRLPFSLASLLPGASADPLGPNGYEAETHGVEIGAIAFTPEDITVRLPPPGERPFASLVYFGHSRHRLSEGGTRLDAVSLTFGALGLDITEELQEEVHYIIDDVQPEGWDSQISSGGEPTARLAYDRRFLLVDRPVSDSNQLQVARSFGVSVGYLTEASVGWSTRVGHFGDNRWWEFSFSGPSGYGVRAIRGVRTKDPAARRAGFFFGEFRLRARFYNAFLEGQFRDSPLTYGRSDLRELLGELTAGFVLELPKRWSVSYVFRVQTAEIAEGKADRLSTWGSLVLTRSFR